MTPSAPVLRHARFRLLAAALASAAAWAPAAAPAATLNVAQLVNGVAEPLPLGRFETKACGSACQYAVVTATTMDNGYTLDPGPLVPAVWPVAFGATLAPYAATQQSMPLPAPPANASYDAALGGANFQRAAVEFDSLPVLNAQRRLSVQTFKSGSGASVASVAVRISTSGSAKKTFLSFTVPQRQRSWQHAWNWSPNLLYQVYSRPDHLQARSTVDVYVDGLPVWSSESHELDPQRRKPSYWQTMRLDWGDAQDGAEVTLFLGTLPAKSVRTAVLVMRSELRIGAPDCRSRTDYGDSFRSCNEQIESLSLPSRAVNTGNYFSQRPAFEVFTH